MVDPTTTTTTTTTTTNKNKTAGVVSIASSSVSSSDLNHLLYYNNEEEEEEEEEEKTNKHHQQQQQQQQQSLLKHYNTTKKDKKWMPSTEDDECSDMISIDYSRNHRDHNHQEEEEEEEDERQSDNGDNDDDDDDDDDDDNSSTIFQSQNSDDEDDIIDVLINTTIEIRPQSMDGSGEYDFDDYDDYDDNSSLSSFNSLDRRTDDIDSDSEFPGRKHHHHNLLLEHSERSDDTGGSQYDRNVLFSPFQQRQQQQHMKQIIQAGKVKEDAEDEDQYKRFVPASSRSLLSGPRSTPKKRSSSSSRSLGEYDDVQSPLSQSKTPRRRGKRSPKKAKQRSSKTGKDPPSPQTSTTPLPLFAANGSYNFTFDDATPSPQDNQRRLMAAGKSNSYMYFDGINNQSRQESISPKRILQISTHSSEKQDEHGDIPSSPELFSPESQGRTFLPKRFQSQIKQKIVPIPLSSHDEEVGQKELKFVDKESKFEIDDKDSVSVASTVDSSAIVRLGDLYEDGKRPAFISDIEYSQPLVDKSELPTTKTKKSLNRKKSTNQQQQQAQPQSQRKLSVSSVDSEVAATDPKAQNSKLLKNILGVVHDDDSIMYDQSSLFGRDTSIDDASVKSSRMKQGDTVSLDRASATSETSLFPYSDSDDYSIMSEISADSIHRNVHVKRTNRKKKSKKGNKSIKTGTSNNNNNNNNPNNSSNSNNDNNNNLNAKKKKKALKKARPKKRGRKSDYEGCEDTDEKDGQNQIDPEEKKSEDTAPIEIEARIDAIFNNKDLIYSDIDKKLSMIASILKPEMEEHAVEKPKSVRIKSQTDESAMEKSKPKSSRIKSKTHQDQGETEKKADVSPNQEGLSNDIRQTGRSRSQSRPKTNPKQATTSGCRLRSDSVDSTSTAGNSYVDHNPATTKMRAKKTCFAPFDPPAQLNGKKFIDKETSHSLQDSNYKKASRSSRSLDSRSLDLSPRRLNPTSENSSPKTRSRSKTATTRPKNDSIEKEDWTSDKKKGKDIGSPRSAKRKLDKASLVTADKAKEKKVETKNATVASKKEKKTESSLMQSPPKSSAAGMNFANFISTFRRKESKSPSPGEKSPRPKKVEAVVDKDVQEALKRHNLGSVVTNLVLGSPVEQTGSMGSPNAKSRKSLKKKIRSTDKQKSRETVDIEAELAELVSRGKEIDDRIKTTGTSPLTMQTPVHSQLGEADVIAPTAKSHQDNNIESLRSHVKKMKKHTKQKIFDIKMQTEEDILNMENTSGHKKAALVEKLKSIGADTDPTAGVKYLRTKKVGKLHEEGKSLRKEIKQLENGICEEATLTTNLISESLEIQKNTQDVLGLIARAERQHAIYTNTVKALQTTHSSLSSLLDEEEAMFQ